MFTFCVYSIQNNVENLESTFRNFIYGASGLRQIQEVIFFSTQVIFHFLIINIEDC